MKTIFIGIFVFGSFTLLNAQKRVELELKYNLFKSSYYYNRNIGGACFVSPCMSPEQRKTWSHAGGFYTTFIPKKVFGIKFGLQYAKRGQKYYEMYGIPKSPALDVDYTLNYIEIPVMVCFSTPPKSRIGVDGGIGPSFNILISGEATYQELVETNLELIHYNPSGFKSGYVGITVNLHLKVKIFKQGFIKFGPEWHQSITNVNDAPVYAIYEQSSRAYPPDGKYIIKALGFNFGFSYLFDKSKAKKEEE